MERTAFRTKKSRETYQAILKTAISLFEKKGFAGTSLRDIAAKRRMSLGSLYYYFPSKEAVVLAFYEDLNRALVEEVRPGIASASDLGAAFEAAMTRKVALLSPARGFLHVVAREALDPESPLSPFSRESQGALDLSLSLFREMVDRLGAPPVAGTRAPPGRARDLARLLWLAHLGILLFWLHDRSEAQAGTRRLIETASTALRWLPALQALPGAEWLEAQIASALAGLHG